MLVIVMGVFALVVFVRLADAAREGKGGARAWVLIEAALSFRSPGWACS